jgi:CheY-like chemotaxis protein
VVDDQDDIRMLLRSWLTCMGFEVAEQASGDAALALLAAGARPDVVILDNELGEPRRGVDLAPMFKAVAPATRIVMFSAAIDTDTPFDGVDRTINKCESVARVGDVVDLLARAAATP